MFTGNGIKTYYFTQPTKVTDESRIDAAITELDNPPLPIATLARDGISKYDIITSSCEFPKQLLNI
jgi:hypothetical protein